MATLWRVTQARHDAADADEDAEDRRRRRSGRDRQLRNGADDHAAPVRRACSQILAVGGFALQPFLVMERIAGKTLYARLDELPLPYAEVAEIGVKIATALDDLHRQHVIHLDIKPSNIMLRPSGEAVLLDFGLSHHEQLPDLMQEEFRAAVRHRALHVAGTAARHPQ